MPQDLLTALMGVCLVGALSYITNQLPALRQFRGSGVLLVLLAIELPLLIWVLQVSSDGDELYQAHRAWFDGGKLVLWGASGVTLLLLVVGLLRDTPQTVNAPHLNLRDRLLQAELEEVEKRQDDSLHHQILIDLGMTDEREQVGRPSKQLITNETAVSLPAATRMIEVFRRKEVGGRLLILGEPGAGKTTMLLELAKSLLKTGQQDNNAPVPVILELSTWREDKDKTLKDWLVKQICQKYQNFNRRTCYEWLESGQILPLLDGLDELGNRDRQEKAITAINDYLKVDATLKLAVCCRWENYQESQSQITQLNGAVRLQPLTNAQIRDYLWQLKRGNLWSHIRRDTTLLELARMPLFLHMMVVAYQEVQPFHSQADLFDAYILRRFELPVRKQVYSGSKQELSQQKTRHYLVWLAKQMQWENETEFLIERLQPSWLTTRKQKWLYRLIYGLIAGLIAGLIYGLRFALIGGLIFGLIFGLNKIAPVETVQIPTTNVAKQEVVKELWVGLIFGLIFGLIAGLIFGLIAGLIGGLIGGLIFGLIFGLIAGLIFGLKADLQSRTFPNQGIRASAKNVAILMLLISLIFLVSWLFLRPSIQMAVGEAESRMFGGLLAATLFLSFYFCGGLACIQHLALRIVLWQSKLAPWNYAKFLAYAAELRLIQQVGGRYRFIHRLLRDHFAAMR